MGTSQDYSNVPDWVAKPEGYQTGAMVKYKGNIFYANFWASEPGVGDANSNGWRFYDELYDQTTTAKTSKAKVIAYIPEWRQAEGFDYGNPEYYKYITHGIVSFLTFSESALGLFEPLSVSNVRNVLLQSTVVARLHNTKILVAIGGAADYGFLRLMTEIGKYPESNLTSIAVENVIKFVSDFNLDGVDLDLECWWGKPGEQDQGGRLKGDGPHPAGIGLCIFAKKLKEAMPNKILSMATFATSWFGNCYDSSIYNYVDWILIMSYDLTGSWNLSPVGPHSALHKIRNQDSYLNEQQGNWPSAKKDNSTTKRIEDNPINSVEESIWYWTNPLFVNWQGAGQKIPREKICLGVAAYGYDFSYSKEPDDLTKQIPPGYKVIRYKDIVDQYQEAAITEFGNIKVDGIAPRPVFVDAPGQYPYKHNIYFETPAMAVKKLNFSMDIGTQGVGVWELSNDTWDQDKSILKALYGASGNPKPEDETSYDQEAKDPAVGVNNKGIVAKAYLKNGIVFLRIGQHFADGIIWNEMLLNASENIDKPTEISIDINDNGFLILVWEAPSSKLYYRIGYVSPDTSEFSWAGPPKNYGTGIRPYVRLSNQNKVIEIHQAGFEIALQDLLYSIYDLSFVNEKPDGSLLEKKSPTKYDRGREPALTIIENATNPTVVEVHMGDWGLEKLWIRVGELMETEIRWASTNYNYDWGEHPSIASTQDGYIVEVHKSDGLGYANLWYRLGKLTDSGTIDWVNERAIQYSTGEHPYITLSGTSLDYILIEAHGADTWQLDLPIEPGIDPPERPPEIITITTSLEAVHDLLGDTGNPDLDFYEKFGNGGLPWTIGLDLGSDGFELSDDGNLKIVPLKIAPCRAQDFWEAWKNVLNFIPFIGDIVSLVENSISCQQGESSACALIALDTLFLGLDIIPGVAQVKGSAKGVAAIAKGIDKAAAKSGSESIFVRLDGTNAKGFKQLHLKRTERLNDIEFEKCYPCLRSNKRPPTVPEFIPKQIGVTDMMNLLSTDQAMLLSFDSEDGFSVDLNKILDEGEGTARASAYNEFITMLREKCRKWRESPRDDKALFFITFHLGADHCKIGYNKDLYLMQINATELKGKNLSYNGWDHTINDRWHLQEQFKTLCQSDPNKFLDQKQQGKMKPCLHHFIAFSSEAARFGIMRHTFSLLVKDKNGAINFLKLQDLCTKGWDSKTLGIEDDASLNGDGSAVGSRFKCGPLGIEVLKKP